VFISCRNVRRAIFDSGIHVSKNERPNHKNYARCERRDQRCERKAFEARCPSTHEEKRQTNNSTRDWYTNSIHANFHRTPVAAEHGPVSRQTCFRSARAPGLLCAEAGTRAAAPFPAPLSPLAALFLRCAPDKFSLTKPNTSCTIEMPAALRSEGVRVHPRMPFGFPSETAFGFAGILTLRIKLSISPARFDGIISTQRSKC
jgi:hypothetical protein